MNYESAAVMTRFGDDDYSLWIVELPASAVEDIKKTECCIRGELEQLMKQVPVLRDQTANRLQLLSQGGNVFSLYFKDMPDDFFRKYSDHGWSSRGNEATIRSEIEEWFAAQEPLHAPSMT